MGTTPSKPSGASKVLDVLNGLLAAGGPVSIGLQVGAVVIPLVVALIKKIKARGTGTTATYEIVLSATQAQLDAIITGAGADLADINAELAKLGLPPLAPPTPAPPTQ